MAPLLAGKVMAVSAWAGSYVLWVGALQEANSNAPPVTKLPTIKDPRSCFMGLILLEALLALIVLLLIVWWTMFSGRKKGELVSKEDAEMKPQKEKEDA